MGISLLLLPVIFIAIKGSLKFEVWSGDTFVKEYQLSLSLTQQNADLCLLPHLIYTYISDDIMLSQQAITSIYYADWERVDVVSFCSTKKVRYMMNRMFYVYIGRIVKGYVLSIDDNTKLLSRDLISDHFIMGYYQTFSDFITQLYERLTQKDISKNEYDIDIWYNSVMDFPHSENISDVDLMYQEFIGLKEYKGYVFFTVVRTNIDKEWINDEFQRRVIQLILLSGDVINVELEKGQEKVLGFKDAVYEKTGIPNVLQKYIYDGKVVPLLDSYAVMDQIQGITEYYGKQLTLITVNIVFMVYQVKYDERSNIFEFIFDPKSVEFSIKEDTANTFRHRVCEELLLGKEKCGLLVLTFQGNYIELDDYIEWVTKNEVHVKPETYLLIFRKDLVVRADLHRALQNSFLT